MILVKKKFYLNNVLFTINRNFTKIVIVTSHKDANADPVYPTMSVPLRKSYPNVHVLPDPSMIDLNGIVMGMTSTDIMQHIISNELAL